MGSLPLSRGTSPREPVPGGRYLIVHPPDQSIVRSFDCTEGSNVVGFMRKVGILEPSTASSRSQSQQQFWPTRHI